MPLAWIQFRGWEERRGNLPTFLALRPGAMQGQCIPWAHTETRGNASPRITQRPVKIHPFTYIETRGNASPLITLRPGAIHPLITLRPGAMHTYIYRQSSHFPGTDTRGNASPWLTLRPLPIVDRPATPNFRFNQPANNMDNFPKWLIGPCCGDRLRYDLSNQSSKV